MKIVSAQITGVPDLFWYVKADSAVKTMKDMNGRTMGYSRPGSSTHLVAMALGGARRSEAQVRLRRRRAGHAHPGDVRADRRRLVGAALQPGPGERGQGARRRQRHRPRRDERADHPRQRGEREVPQGEARRGAALLQGLPRDHRMGIRQPGEGGAAVRRLREGDPRDRPADHQDLSEGLGGRLAGEGHEAEHPGGGGGQAARQADVGGRGREAALRLPVQP